MLCASPVTVTSSPTPMATAAVSPKPTPSTVTESPGMRGSEPTVMLTTCAFVIGIANVIKNAKRVTIIIFVLCDILLNSPT